MTTDVGTSSTQHSNICRVKTDENIKFTAIKICDYCRLHAQLTTDERSKLVSYANMLVTVAVGCQILMSNVSHCQQPTKLFTAMSGVMSIQNTLHNGLTNEHTQRYRDVEIVSAMKLESHRSSTIARNKSLYSTNDPHQRWHMPRMHAVDQPLQPVKEG